MAIWILTQMKRWGYLKGDVDYRQIGERVFLATEARKRLAELGRELPDAARAKNSKYSVMGKEFDPADPAGYLASFAIKKSA
jgi:nitrate/nitrite transport system substrate-binding protein